MLGYIAKRLFQIVPVFIGTTLLLFIAMYIVPGDPVGLMTGGRSVDQARHREIRRQLNLDKPVYRQYALYMERLAGGDLGVS
ncbi:MAG: peptide ABC transporter permease, partial [Chloroflexi bacterium]|nr:peptide ABC transporter permease [Chloroflexota bacterium]